LFGVIVGASLAGLFQFRFERRRERREATTRVIMVALELGQAQLVIKDALDKGKWWPPELLNAPSVTWDGLPILFEHMRDDELKEIGRAAAALTKVRLESLVAAARDSPELTDEQRESLEETQECLEYAVDALDDSELGQRVDYKS
jgi:hypothetical protein